MVFFFKEWWHSLQKDLGPIRVIEAGTGSKLSIVVELMTEG